MNAVDIINKKRLNRKLTKEEIEFFIKGFLNDVVKDYQMSALLMAITINGMTFDEIINLTDVMLKSGDILDLSLIEGVKVDKHSTGGVGDKVTIILAPILASLGIPVAKMSGKGLGLTGGTIDKLESVGINTNLTFDEFIKQVKDINMVISGATLDIAVADKKIYALRDVTATVSSIGLIASSIMSKKLASGADLIVIDVKVGSGALLKTKKEAIELSKCLVRIGKHYKKQVYCILTNMDEPLGYTIGNSLEVEESIDALRGNGAKDLMEVVYSIASIIISEYMHITREEALSVAIDAVHSRKAYLKFMEFVNVQKGDISNIKKANSVIEIRSLEDGYIKKIDPALIATVARDIGAGRITKQDKIDYNVGIVLDKKVADYVNKDEILGKIYYNDIKPDIDKFRKSFNITKEEAAKKKTIYGMVDCKIL